MSTKRTPGPWRNRSEQIEQLITERNRARSAAAEFQRVLERIAAMDIDHGQAAILARNQARAAIEAAITDCDAIHIQAAAEPLSSQPKETT
jgi:hypothetical protein